MSHLAAKCLANLIIRVYIPPRYGFTRSLSAQFSSKAAPRSKKQVDTRNVLTVDVWDGIKISEISKITKRPLDSIIKSVNSGLLGSFRVNASTSIENRELLTGLLSLLGYRPNFVRRKSTEAENRKQSKEEFDVYPRPPPDPSICVLRPPVVAIMGHVDHGKTTLLDALRSSRIVDQEFGGITQHISAFSISVAEAAAADEAEKGASESDVSCSSALQGVITFIDTPGHAAFSAMRARGAKATDIVLLVVAADDGVMPQTVESIRFAKEYGAQLVVAINKIDKYGTDVKRVEQSLASAGVLVEAQGGSVQAVAVSALRRRGLVALLEALLAQAELMQLAADPTGPAEALVLECSTEHGLGKVVNCLVTRGQLRQGGGPLVAGESVGRTRVLRDDRGARVTSVGPGYTVSIAGWKSLPPVGSTILEVASEAEAEAAVRVRRQRRLAIKAEMDRAAIEERSAYHRTTYDAYLRERAITQHGVDRKRLVRDFRKSQASLAALVNDATGKGEGLSLPLVLKADVEGSLEAIADMLATCPPDQCRVSVAHSGVGPVTPAEVDLAAAIGAEIFAFNVGVLPDAQSALSAHKVSLHSHNIIYRLAEDVHSLVTGKLPPVYVEEIVGEGVVLQTFEVTVVRGKRQEVVVGGCRCTRGNILSGKSPKHGTDPILFRVVRPADDHQKPTSTKTSGKHKEKGREKKAPTDETDKDSDDRVTKGRVLVDRAVCFSLRHTRNDVDSVRCDVEFGIVLLKLPSEDEETRDLAHLYKHPPSASSSDAVAFDGWTQGDVVQCYRVAKRPQTLQWEIDHLLLPVE